MLILLFAGDPTALSVDWRRRCVWLNGTIILSNPGLSSNGPPLIFQLMMSAIAIQVNNPIPLSEIFTDCGDLTISANCTCIMHIHKHYVTVSKKTCDWFTVEVTSYLVAGLGSRKLFADCCAHLIAAEQPRRVHNKLQRGEWSENMHAFLLGGTDVLQRRLVT